MTLQITLSASSQEISTLPSTAPVDIALTSGHPFLEAAPCIAPWKSAASANSSGNRTRSPFATRRCLTPRLPSQPRLPRRPPLSLFGIPTTKTPVGLLENVSTMALFRAAALRTPLKKNAARKPTADSHLAPVSVISKTPQPKPPLSLLPKPEL